MIFAALYTVAMVGALNICCSAQLGLVVTFIGWCVVVGLWPVCSQTVAHCLNLPNIVCVRIAAVVSPTVANVHVTGWLSAEPRWNFHVRTCVGTPVSVRK